MVPHHVQGNGRDPARFGAKPPFGFGDFGQVIRQDIDPAVHKDALYNVSRPVAGGVATNEIGQQITGQRTVGEMSKVQVCKKIHRLIFVLRW